MLIVCYLLLQQLSYGIDCPDSTAAGRKQVTQFQSGSQQITQHANFLILHGQSLHNVRANVTVPTMMKVHKLQNA